MDLFVARQPIFDAQGRIYGYELLYRRRHDSVRADGESTSQMSRDVIIQSFLGIGLESLTRGTRGFVNFSRDMLLGGYYDLLNPANVVIELLETVDADHDADVIAACRRLVDLGYTLALDDFVAETGQDSLLPLASIVKIDVLNRGEEELRKAIEPLSRHGLRLLAERVETAEVRDQCRAMGFELFQGYFFSRPEVVTKRDMSVQQATIIELMNLIHDESATDHTVEDGFRRDPSLSYKLLRMVNAAAHGGRGIESIQHAIRLLGRGALLRWLGLLLASSLVTRGDLDLELVHLAVTRARLCELVAEASDRHAEAGRLFILGLFSLMDALLGLPMDEVLQRVDLTPDVRQALLDRSGPFAGWLELVQAYEKGQWNDTVRQAARLRVDPDRLPELYVESLNWARTQLGILHG